MKKKFLFGVIAVLCIAFNVVAFTSYAEAPGGSGGGSVSVACYQTMCYVTPWRLSFCCQTQKTGERCKRYVVSNCPQHQQQAVEEFDRAVDIRP